MTARIFRANGQWHVANDDKVVASFSLLAHKNADDLCWSLNHGRKNKVTPDVAANPPSGRVPGDEQAGAGGILAPAGNRRET